MPPLPDDRCEPPADADERTVLVGWLEFHRATLARKCAGLTDAQLRTCALPPSTLSLVGLVRHLTEIERLYIRHGFAGEPLSPLLYVSDTEPDGDFDVLDDVGGSMAAWREHVEAARAHVAVGPAAAGEGGGGRQRGIGPPPAVVDLGAPAPAAREGDRLPPMITGR